MLDQWKIKLQKDKADAQASLTALLTAVRPPVESGSPDVEADDSSPAPSAEASQVHFEAIRTALSHL